MSIYICYGLQDLEILKTCIIFIHIEKKPQTRDDQMCKNKSMVVKNFRVAHNLELL